MLELNKEVFATAEDKAYRIDVRARAELEAENARLKALLESK